MKTKKQSDIVATGRIFCRFCKMAFEFEDDFEPKSYIDRQKIHEMHLANIHGITLDNMKRISDRAKNHAW